MQSLQDPREYPARRDPATAQHADLEIGSGAEMPILQEGAIRAAGAHDQVDGGARSDMTQKVVLATLVGTIKSRLQSPITDR